MFSQHISPFFAEAVTKGRQIFTDFLDHGFVEEFPTSQKLRRTGCRGKLVFSVGAGGFDHSEEVLVGVSRPHCCRLLRE